MTSQSVACLTRVMRHHLSLELPNTMTCLSHPLTTASHHPSSLDTTRTPTASNTSLVRAHFGSLILASTRVLRAVVWVHVFTIQGYGVLQYATCLTRVTLTTLATLYPFLLTTTIRPSCATTVDISHAPCLAQCQSMLMRPFCRSTL